MQIIKEYYKDKLNYYKDYITNKNLKISLAIFQVGDSEASNRYVRNKIKACEKVGITCNLYKYDETISEEDFICDLKLANSLNCLTGIIVQLPLPKHISEEKVKLAISPEKDVDGFHPLSKTNPATPQGIVTYLEDQNYDFVDKNALILGRSDIVGRPMAKLLLNKSCNVSVIHSKTSEYNKRQLIRNANLIIVATGHRNTLTDDDLTWTVQCGDECEYYDEIVNSKAFIFDVGINFTEDGKLVGDCENVTVCEKTPVPFGVGLLTRLAVIENLIKLAE